MKKREKIYSLLNRISRKPWTRYDLIVVIIGGQPSMVLYEGSLWGVPFSRCSDYVKSYTLDDNVLRIVSTILPRD